MLFNVKERKLKIDKTEIDMISFGNGAKKLVMIQGLNTQGIKGSGISLAFMYRIFTKEYTVYLFDRRPDIEEKTTVRDFAADVAAAMDTLKIKNADIFGVSQGGMIAQYLAIDRPDLVNKLVLALTLSRNNDTVTHVIENWIDLTKKNKIKDLVSDIAERMYSDDYIKRYRPFIPLLAILQKPKDPQRFIRLAMSCLSCNSYEELEKIKCPTLVIGGGDDRVVGAEASKETADRINCEFYMYDRLGHAAYEEAPDFNNRVYEFLSK